MPFAKRNLCTCILDRPRVDDDGRPQIDLAAFALRGAFAGAMKRFALQRVFGDAVESGECEGIIVPSVTETTGAGDGGVRMAGRGEIGAGCFAVGGGHVDAEGGLRSSGRRVAGFFLVEEAEELLSLQLIWRKKGTGFG